MHRLDVGTSGVMVVALSERAYTVLKRAFKQRTVDKRYHALVQGHPDPMSGTIDAPIGRHPGHDWRFAVIDGGLVTPPLADGVLPGILRGRLLAQEGRVRVVEARRESGRSL